MPDEFRQALEACDVAKVRRMSKHLFPQFPQPKTDAEALVSLHFARTQMPNITFKLRAYSHAWLCERGLPSGLPDQLKPKAQRLYPVVVGAVGIAVVGRSEIGRQIAPMIQGAMSDAVSDAYADKKTDPVFVKGRMMEARDRAVKQLIGRCGADHNGGRQ